MALAAGSSGSGSAHLHRSSPHDHHATHRAPEIQRHDTALLLIDLQYHGAHPDHGLLRDQIAAGRRERVDYFADRVARLVVPNARHLQDAFRAAGMEVIHVKTQSLTADGRDRSLEAKQHGTHIPPGSQEGEILAELAPMADEIVFSKTCMSVFNGTNIEYVLRNVGIRNLVVVGVVTGSCVELAVRDAADRGFVSIVVEDATASWSAEMQAAAIDGLRDRAATIMSTAAVVDLVNVLAAGDTAKAATAAR
jgi:nicotinamidase-related amidase